MIPGLLITEGNKRGYIIEFSEGEMFWIGRSKECNLVLKDSKVSSKHCFLLRREDKLAFKDESTNGTRLNGRKIYHTSTILKYADILRIGGTHFQVTNLEKSSDSEDFDFQACMEDIEQREEFPDDEDFLHSLGPYLNIEVIGSGGFSTVYKSVNQVLKKIVALKVFTSLEVAGSDFMKRFFREMEILRKLNHPSLIQLHDSGTLRAEKKKYSYIALEYFQGINLHDYLQTYGALPWQKVIQIIYRVTQALDYMHHYGILHRDIKPGNILYNPINSKVKIIDLGLGKCILSEERETLCITRPNSGMGTPNYMPLEQWGDAKNVDERADIYALGATAYTLLTNIIPFGAQKNPSKIYRNLVSQNLVPLKEICPKDIPGQLIIFIEKMMAFDIRDRIRTSKKLMRSIQSNPILKYSIESI